MQAGILRLAGILRRKERRVLPILIVNRTPSSENNDYAFIDNNLDATATARRKANVLFPGLTPATIALTTSA